MKNLDYHIAENHSLLKRDAIAPKKWTFGHKKTGYLSVSEGESGNVILQVYESNEFKYMATFSKDCPPHLVSQSINFILEALTH